MATEPATVTIEPQEGSPATPQPQEGNPSTTEPQEGGSQNTLSLEEVKKLRSEAQAMRARLKASEAKATELDQLKAELEASKLSEKEQLEKKNADLQAKLDAVTTQAQKRLIDAEIRLQMAQLGVKSPDKVARLIDRAQITTDDDGTPTNVSELIKDLLKDIPELAGKSATPTTGGATNPARSSSSTLPPISEEYITQLVQTEDGRKIYDARRAEIQRWRSQPENMFRFGR